MSTQRPTLSREKTHGPQKVALNSAVTILARLSALGIGFILTPFIVGRLGITVYGVWTLIASFLAYITLLDPGLSDVTYRFASRHLIRREFETVGQIATLCILLYLALGVVFLPFAWLALPTIVSHLHIPVSLRHEAFAVCFFNLAYFFLSAAGGIFTYLLSAMGDLWLASLFDTISRFFYALGVVVLLLNGFGLYGLLLATTLQGVVSTTLTALMCRHRMGRILRSPKPMGRTLLSELSKYGAWVQLGGLFDIITFETDPVVIGGLLPVANVGVYELGDSLASVVQFLPATMILAVFPSAVAAVESGDGLRSTRVFQVASRAQALMGGSVACAITAISPIFLYGWLGRSYHDLGVVVEFLLGVYVARVLVGTAGAFARALGEPAIWGRITVWGALINAVFTVGLGIPFGLRGILVGTLLGASVRSGLFLLRFHRRVELSMWRYSVVPWLRVLGSGLLVAIPMRLALEHWLPAAHTARIYALLESAGFGLLAFVLIVVSLRLSGFYEVGDDLLLTRALSARLSSLLRLRGVRLLFGFEKGPSKHRSGSQRLPEAMRLARSPSPKGPHAPTGSPSRGSR